MLRVEAPPAAFATLLQDLSGRGLRVGWLELDDPEPPASLAAAAGAGAVKAVAAGPRRTVALKIRLGAPVLDDLLREHFLGCDLLLVHGPLEAPLLEPAGDAWKLTGDGPTRRLTLADLARRLRRH